jgi:hypothetical protein
MVVVVFCIIRRFFDCFFYSLYFSYSVNPGVRVWDVFAGCLLSLFVCFSFCGTGWV